MVPDNHRSEPALEDLAIGTVHVSNDIAWCVVPADGFGELTGDPFCCPVRCARQVE